MSLEEVHGTLVVLRIHMFTCEQTVRSFNPIAPARHDRETRMRKRTFPIFFPHHHTAKPKTALATDMPHVPPTDQCWVIKLRYSVDTTSSDFRPNVFTRIC